MKNENIKTAVRTLYDMQKLRIQLGNRICSSYRSKLGLSPSDAEQSNEDASNILEQLRKEHKLITEGVKKVTRLTKIKSDILTTKGEVDLISSYEAMLISERYCEKSITDELLKQKIWTDYLINIRGCGVLMAGIILSEIDIEKCSTVSSLWRYCGLDVVIYEKDGVKYEEGRSRKKNHLTEKKYVNRDGEEIDTVGITFNPFLKTKMIGVLGSSFIKLGGEYRVIYDDYKHRLENNPKHADKTKAHRHNMAVRYMIKEFLADLYTQWRIIENLEVRPRYNEEKLGIIHSKKAMVS